MNAIFEAILATSALEWAAVSTTTLCIWLAGQNKVLTWPVGIVAVLLYAVLFVDAKLYADALLQVFFVGTSVFGWWVWLSRKDKPEIPIRSVKPLMVALMAVVGVAVSYGYSLALIHYTDSPAPMLDSMVLVFSVIGQLLLMMRYIQNWPTWILVNTVSVPLYFSRELFVTAIMYAVFWIHAWYAWWVWSKETEESV
jgi:nicotinamide mononucleotide transporter